MVTRDRGEPYAGGRVLGTGEDNTRELDTIMVGWLVDKQTGEGYLIMTRRGSFVRADGYEGEEELTALVQTALDSLGGFELGRYVGWEDTTIPDLFWEPRTHVSVAPMPAEQGRKPGKNRHVITVTGNSRWRDQEIVRIFEADEVDNMIRYIKARRRNLANLVLTKEVE